MYTVTDNGVLKAVESWCVVLPLHDNDGQPFESGVIESILQEILLNYPGFSRSSSIGYWKSTEQTYIDENYQVVIDVIPDDIEESVRFFAKLKHELQTNLHQEKIYITRQESKQEFLSFDEFFNEVGIEAQSNDLKEEANRIAKQVATRFDFVLQRLGYETTALKRDTKEKKIIWERRICGIKLKSEFHDSLPETVRIIAADQLHELGPALVRQEAFAIVGGYEFISYVLEKTNHRSLVEVDDIPESKVNTRYFSQLGEPLSLKKFIEDFTMTVFTNWLILRDEGFFPEEIKLSVGSDGSLQHGESDLGSMLLLSPAMIPEQVVQKEVIRCLTAAIHANEDNSIDPIAVLQAKAKNNYVLKRAFVRHTLRNRHST